jgi:hypothetical protein
MPRKLRYRAFLLLLRGIFAGVLAIACISVSPRMWSQERPWAVSPCELLKNPNMYADTMVSVPGLILYSPREFTTHGYDCADDHGPLPLIFGGDPTDPKDQFRLPQSRLEAGTVPLKKDTDYEGMLHLMKQVDASGEVKMLRATLRGRFFTGQAVGSKSGAITYPNARLVISEVELVSNRLEDPVDFTPVSQAPAKPPKGCTTADMAVPSREEEDKFQRLSREPSENLEYLAKAEEVAARAIASQANLPADEILGKLKLVSKGIALKSFSWSSSNGVPSYTVTVNRPYWLLPSTYSGDSVIWVPKQIRRTDCAASANR